MISSDLSHPSVSIHRLSVSSRVCSATGSGYRSSSLHHSRSEPPHHAEKHLRPSAGGTGEKPQSHAMVS